VFTLKYVSAALNTHWAKKTNESSSHKRPISKRSTIRMGRTHLHNVSTCSHLWFCCIRY